MATYKRRLRDKDGNTIYPDVGLELDEVIYGDDPGQAETPSPWIETGDIKDNQITSAKIADGAITGPKMDFSSVAGTAVIKTITDVMGRIGFYFADGTLITTRKAQYVGAINTAWGSLYEGHTNDYYRFAPTGGTDFISEPNVQATLFNDANSGSCWLGAWEKSPQIVNGWWSVPTGALCFVRASSAPNVTLNLYIQAIGRWK